MGGTDAALTGPDLVAGIAATDLKPGEKLLGHANGEAVLLARIGDDFFAIGATCSHYGGPLAEGTIVGDTVRCPWHHACFSLRNGEALRAPALSNVSCWRVDRRGDRVVVTGKVERELLAPTFPIEHRADNVHDVVIVGAGAAGYAAAEARVRLEVARQYPDLQLGPGMFFDHGENKWTLLFGLPSLLLNRNHGPITEAEANRTVAGARFTEQQELVLSELDAALVACSGGLGRLAAADSLAAVAAEQFKLVSESFERGETSRLDVASAGVLVTTAQRSQLIAGVGQAETGLALESALGVWLDDDSPSRWPDPTDYPRGQPVGERDR